MSHLQKAFPESRIITYSSSHSLTFLPNLSKLNLEYPRMGWAISREFARLNKEEEFDLVICNDLAGLGLNVLEPQIPAMQVFHYTYRGFAESALRGLPGYVPSKHFLPWFEKATAHGKRIVAVSHKTRRELESLYGRSATVIENAVPLDVFHPLPQDECRAELGIKWKGPIGIFVGRADPSKGFDVVRQIAKSRKDIKILCVTGSRVEKEDREKMIVFQKVPNEEMPKYYSSADFLLFPSRYESSSYITIEALACDLPVVAYRTGVFEDMDNDKVGVIVERVDYETFMRAIDQILSMERVKTRACAEKRFSMERFIAEYRKLAREMLEKNVMTE
ncbi:MAG: glycosyltransferase family 4 protein [Methanomassiliicoccales archaeon]